MIRPHTNCNINYRNCFTVIEVSLITYQKSQVIRVVESIEIDDDTFSPLQIMLKRLWLHVF